MKDGFVPLFAVVNPFSASDFEAGLVELSKVLLREIALVKHLYLVKDSGIWDVAVLLEPIHHRFQSWLAIHPPAQSSVMAVVNALEVSHVKLFSGMAGINVAYAMVYPTISGYGLVRVIEVDFFPDDLWHGRME